MSSELKAAAQTLREKKPLPMLRIKSLSSSTSAQGSNQCRYHRNIAIKQSMMDMRIRSRMRRKQTLCARNVCDNQDDYNQESTMRLGKKMVDRTRWAASLTFLWNGSSAPDVDHCVLPCLSCGCKRAGVRQGDASNVIGEASE